MKDQLRIDHSVNPRVITGQAPAVGQTETPAESSTALTTAAPSSLPTTRPPSPSSLNPHTPCSTALHSNHGGNGHTTLPSERPPSRNVSPRQASPSSVCTDDLPDKLNDAVARRFSKLSPEDKIEELQRLQDLDEDEIVRENAIAVRDEMLLSLSLTGPQSLFGEFGAIATSKKAKAKAKPKPKKKTAANTKSKPRPRRGLRSSGLQDDTDDAPRTDSAGGQADADNSADSGRDDVPERHSDDNSNGGAPGGSSNARGSGGARNDGDGGDDARNGDDAPDRGANGGSDPNPDVEGGAGASTPLPDVEERTMSMSSPAAPAANQHDASAYIVDVSGTPQWFAEQYRALVQFGEDLASEQREQWLTTLNTWFDLERLSGFAETVRLLICERMFLTFCSETRSQDSLSATRGGVVDPECAQVPYRAQESRCVQDAVVEMVDSREPELAEGRGRAPCHGQCRRLDLVVQEWA